MAVAARMVARATAAAQRWGRQIFNLNVKAK